jgi:VanZ family protein
MRRALTAYAPALIWALFLAAVAGMSELPATPSIPHFDKVAHFGTYAVLGVLLGLGWRWAGFRPRRVWLLTFALLLGLSDEVRHARNPHRSGELGDWIADALGATTGLLLATRGARRRDNDRRRG